jgi:NAD(P)-dependent dehydrogenase (short-subunit alcohol dehydrogenase family)
VARKEDIHPIALQIIAGLGGLDVLVNNASSLGPVPLALLADTECEDFERALATNVLGPFRLTKALLGALSSSAREGRGQRGVERLKRRRKSASARMGRLRRASRPAP